MVITALSLAILIGWQQPRIKETRFAKAMPAPLLVVLLGGLGMATLRTRAA